MSMDYTNVRPRGLASWRPQRKSRELLGQVGDVLEEYADHLPLTVRQLFYRLVGAHGYPKDDRAYARLCELLVRARRAQLIPFDAIRDDGGAEYWPAGFHGVPGFWADVRWRAREYRRDRRDGQPVLLELWCEAGGMLPQMARVASKYGVPVFSSGGFDSLTVKHETARRIAAADRPSVVLHVGDLDPSGVSIFDSFSEDVAAFVADMNGPAVPRFIRAAVTREQARRFHLPESPPKRTDRRGSWTGGTVQAEALAPPDLASEVETAIVAHVDLACLEALLGTEAEERASVCAKLGKVEP